MANRAAVILLEAIPEYRHRVEQAAANYRGQQRMLQALGGEDMETLLGARPGEVLRCAYVENSPNGCGTGKHCASCGAVNAILDALRTNLPVARETQLLTLNGGMEMLVQATFIMLGQCEFVVVAMRDVSSENAARCWNASFSTMCSIPSAVCMVCRNISSKRTSNPRHETGMQTQCASACRGWSSRKSSPTANCWPPSAATCTCRSRRWISLRCCATWWRSIAITGWRRHARCAWATCPRRAWSPMSNCCAACWPIW